MTIDMLFEREMQISQLFVKDSQALWKHKGSAGSRNCKCSYVVILVLEK